MKRLTGLLAIAVLLAFGAATLPDVSGAGSEKKLETKPAPFQTVDGKLVKIEGEFYVVQDSKGKEVRLHVSKETKQLGGTKKVGDKIRAELTASGHALSIQ